MIGFILPKTWNYIEEGGLHGLVTPRGVLTFDPTRATLDDLRWRSPRLGTFVARLQQGPPGLQVVVAQTGEGVLTPVHVLTRSGQVFFGCHDSFTPHLDRFNPAGLSPLRIKGTQMAEGWEASIARAKAIPGRIINFLIGEAKEDIVAVTANEAGALNLVRRTAWSMRYVEESGVLRFVFQRASTLLTLIGVLSFCGDVYSLLSSKPGKASLS